MAVLWLSLGVGALALDGTSTVAVHRQATVTLSTLATLFGLWVFWRDGGRRITAIGLYNFAFALFVGFSGLYLVYIDQRMISTDELLPAVAWAYFLQIPTWLFFWAKNPRPVLDERPAADPAVARWGAWVGACMLLIAAVLCGTQTTTWATGGSWVLTVAAGFVGAVLIGVGLLHGKVHLGVACIGAAAGFGVYAYYIFDGFGRLTLGTLGFGLLVILAQRNRGRLVKTLVLVGSTPVLLILATLRAMFVQRMFPGDTGHGTGLESVVSPLAGFGKIMSYNEAGLVHHDWGGTFLVALVALVPRALWPDKPAGFGAEIVSLLHPQLVGSGHSDAALFHGEWLYNFGLPGLLLMVPATGLVVRQLDKLLLHTATLRLDSRRAVLIYTGAIIAVTGLLDLAWVGTFSYSARTAARLLVLGLVFVLLAWRVDRKNAAADGARAPRESARWRRFSSSPPHHSEGVSRL